MSKKRKIATLKLDSQPATPSSISSDDDVGSSSQGSGRFSVRKETEQRRRNMMNQHFDELVMMLSMVTDRVTPKKMDKTSILEEVVRVVRQYYDLDKSPLLSQEPQYKPGFFSRGEFFDFLLDALGAFMMFVSDNGRILYCSDLITSLTGHMPTRLVGQTIYDCVVAEDQALIKSQFMPPADVAGVKIPESPILAFPPKMFNCALKLYSNDPSSMTISRDFVCLSYLRQWAETECSSCDDSASEFSNSSCILLLGKLSDTDRPRDQSITTNDVNFEFSMRVSKEGKILEIDKQASLVLGYTKGDIQGSSFFEYVDPYHSEKIGEAIEMFLSKGLGVSQPYRLSTKSGQYIWVVSKGFLSYNPWNHKPDHVLLQSKILGCDEVLPEYKFKGDCTKVPNPVEDYSHVPKLNTTDVPQNVKGTLPVESPAMMQTLFPNNDLPDDLNPPISSPEVPELFSSYSTSQSYTSSVNVVESMENMAQLLERKNQELFQLQRRMLEQQQLFEHERKQFYQVTNQVMTYIGKNEGVNVQPYLDPNMSMAIGNASSQPPSVLSPIDKSAPFSQLGGEQMKQVNLPFVSQSSFPQTHNRPSFHQPEVPFSQAQIPFSQLHYSQTHFSHPETHLPQSEFTSVSQTYPSKYMIPNSMSTPNPYGSFGNMTTQTCIPSNATAHHATPNDGTVTSNIPYTYQRVPP